MAFIAYHVDDWREDGVAIAAGTDEDAVRSQAIRRILSLGITSGGITVQPRGDLDDCLDELRETLDRFFAERVKGGQHD